MINGDDDLDKAEEKFNRDDAAFSDRHKVNTNTLNSYIANLTGSIARAEALSKSSDNANMVICFDYFFLITYLIHILYFLSVISYYNL